MIPVPHLKAGGRRPRPRPLSQEEIARGREAARKLAAGYYQGLEAAALDRWWQREFKGRYLGEV